MLPNNNQSGSAIIYVLIGVVLFGVVMYSISRSASTSKSTVGKGNVSLQAENIIQYAQSVEKGVQRVLTKGCSEDQISFQVVSTDFYTNPNSPLDKTCHVFDGAGGKTTFKPPKREWGVNAMPTGLYAMGHCGMYIGSDNNCSTAANVELYYYLANITKELCLELNRKLGVTNPNGDTPTDNWNINPANNSAKFTGTYSVGATGSTGFLSSAEMNGKASACLKDGVGSTANQYIFYHVLLAR